MGDEKVLTVPFVVYESATSKLERTIKRLFIVLILTIICLVGTNVAWVVYEAQFETISYDQDGEGINNVNFGDQGWLRNGAGSTGQEEEER